jgi:hypothetical protein
MLQAKRSMFVTLLTFHQIAGARRIQKPLFQIAGEDRSTSAADDNIYEDDSVKRSILSSPLVEFSTVYSATNNFSEKLGEGGFGPVFKVGYWIIHILPPVFLIWLSVQLVLFIHLDNHSGYLMVSPGDTARWPRDCY